MRSSRAGHRQAARADSGSARSIGSDDPAESGDYITCNLTFKNGAVELSSAGKVIRRPVLSFRDGRIEDFDKVMKVCQRWRNPRGHGKISGDAPNESLRNRNHGRLRGARNQARAAKARRRDAREMVVLPTRRAARRDSDGTRPTVGISATAGSPRQITASLTGPTAASPICSAARLAESWSGRCSRMRATASAAEIRGYENDLRQNS